LTAALPAAPLPSPTSSACNFPMQI
jgi:hypothetical protein